MSLVMALLLWNLPRLAGHNEMIITALHTHTHIYEHSTYKQTNKQTLKGLYRHVAI